MTMSQSILTIWDSKKSNAEIIQTLLNIEDLIIASCSNDPRIELYKFIICKYYSEEFKLTNIQSFHQLKDLLLRAKMNWSSLKIISDGFLLPNNLVEELYRRIRDINFKQTDFNIIENVFEYLSSKTSKGSKGQFFTPRFIINEIVQLLDVKSNYLICDPACGSGGFLVSTSNYFFKSKSISYFGFDYDPFAIITANVLKILKNKEINYTTINSLIKQNVTLSDRMELSIEEYMKSINKRFGGFDIIVTNPPFGGEITDDNIKNMYSIINGNSIRPERDLLFVERCYDLLKPDGQMLIVLPSNKLSDSKYILFRDWLLRHFKILNIISLHRDTFLPHTHQKTVVVNAIRRKYPVSNYENDQIAFSISEKSGKDKKGNTITLNNIVDTDLSEIIQSIKGIGV
jgi:type I restriction enzyme M protein